MAAATIGAGTGLAGIPSATADTVAAPSAYSAGGDAGFVGTLTYTDSSTLSKLFLHLNVTGSTELTFLSVTKNGSAVAGACGASLPLDCTFRQARTGDVYRVQIGARPAADAADVTAEYIWSSTGATSSDPGSSHGDTWSDAATALLNGDPDFGGGLSTGKPIANFQALSAANLQSARLENVPLGVPATVLDGPDATGVCVDTPTVDCSDFTSEWIELNVGDGQTFGSPFMVVVAFYSYTPKAFLHSFVDEAGVSQQELILQCPKKGFDGTTACFTWSAKSKTATIFTRHNGSMRG
jgi:hypothetical protein